MKDCIQPSSHDDDRFARQLAALAHPARLRILRALACRRLSCCKDVVAELPLAQSTVSQHLKVLADAGLVTVDRRRPHSHYQLDRRALDGLVGQLEGFVAACGAADAAGKPLAEPKDTSLV